MGIEGSGDDFSAPDKHKHKRYSNIVSNMLQDCLTVNISGISMRGVVTEV